MDVDGALRTRELASELAVQFGADVSVERWEHGFDFFADRVFSQSRETQVVLSPRIEVLDTSYEGQVDFGEIVVRQAQAYRVAELAGVSVPRVHLALHRDHTRIGRSVLVLDEIADDRSWSATTEHQLGEMLALLHALPGSSISSSDQPWIEYVVSGLRLRLSAAAKYVEFAPVDVEQVLCDALDAVPARRTDRLLHLDIRRPNIRVVNDEIRGLIDFANCCSGDPVFELARMRYCDLLTTDFLCGYGIDDPGAWLELHRKLLAVYELNIAALLVVVGVEEADDDDELASTAASRLIELVDIIDGP